MDKNFEKNNVDIAGTVVAEPEYSHEVCGEKFYVCKIETERTSGFKDVIPLTISDRLFRVGEQLTGYRLRVVGQFRSYNLHAEDGNHLVLSVFVRDIEQLDDDNTDMMHKNEIYLDGYICKDPIYRKTPQGREIADVLLAVNRSYGKSDFIPCIYWGRNARFASGLEVGSRVKICGRIQSREYQKRISDTETETRVAYEVSVSKIELVEEE